MGTEHRTTNSVVSCRVMSCHVVSCLQFAWFSPFRFNKVIREVHHRCKSLNKRPLKCWDVHRMCWVWGNSSFRWGRPWTTHWSNWEVQTYLGWPKWPLNIVKWCQVMSSKKGYRHSRSPAKPLIAALVSNICRTLREKLGSSWNHWSTLGKKVLRLVWTTLTFLYCESCTNTH